MKKTHCTNFQEKRNIRYSVSNFVLFKMAFSDFQSFLLTFFSSLRQKISLSVFNFVYFKRRVPWKFLKIRRNSYLEDGQRIILRYSDYFSGELGGRKTIFEFLEKIKIFQQNFSKKFFNKIFQQNFSNKFFGCRFQPSTFFDFFRLFSTFFDFFRLYSTLKLNEIL